MIYSIFGGSIKTSLPSFDLNVLKKCITKSLDNILTFFPVSREAPSCFTVSFKWFYIKRIKDAKRK